MISFHFSFLKFITFHEIYFIDLRNEPIIKEFLEVFISFYYIRIFHSLSPHVMYVRTIFLIIIILFILYVYRRASTTQQVRMNLIIQQKNIN